LFSIGRRIASTGFWVPCTVAASWSRLGIDQSVDWLRSPFQCARIYDPDGGPRLQIRGVSEFRGGHLEIIGSLKRYLEEDAEAGLAAEQHRWITPKMLQRSKEAVRQQVSRCRREFAREFAAIEGRAPDRHILVEGKRPKGYRLDPDARFASD
jgi:hypothetical protein